MAGQGSAMFGLKYVSWAVWYLNKPRCWRAVLFKHWKGLKLGVKLILIFVLCYNSILSFYAKLFFSSNSYFIEKVFLY